MVTLKDLEKMSTKRVYAKPKKVNWYGGRISMGLDEYLFTTPTSDLHRFLTTLKTPLGVDKGPSGTIPSPILSKERLFWLMIRHKMLRSRICSALH